MRLYTNVFFMISNSNEEYVNQVRSSAQRIIVARFPQEIEFANSGQAQLAPGAVATVSQAGATSAKARLLDLSCDGAANLAITQGGVTSTLPVKGTAACPARVTLTLDANVTAVTLTSTEGTANLTARWMVAEYIDITNVSNFPVV